MINFTVGPVQSNDNIRNIGSEQVPYFRTQSFSNIMLENEKMMLDFCNAPKGSRVCFMTCSGTGSMEASIINVLNKNDKALIINGGSFGERFVEICKIHNYSHSVIKLEHGKSLSEERLFEFDGKGFTSLIVNAHETSTGVLYDLDMISNFCKKNNLLLIVDAISSFLADPFDMSALSADVVITGSQKALACPPGVSIIVLSPKAIERVMKNDPKCMYLDLKSALINGERGQTPFTCAVGILRQINLRLKEIKMNGGAESEIEKVKKLSQYFRAKLKKYPFQIVSERMSNAVTPLHPINGKSAYEIVRILEKEYNIWVCPNGGDMRETIFRVGHIGFLKKADYDVLFNAFDDMIKRGLL